MRNSVPSLVSLPSIACLLVAIPWPSVVVAVPLIIASGAGRPGNAGLGWPRQTWMLSVGRPWFSNQKMVRIPSGLIAIEWDLHQMGYLFTEWIASLSPVLTKVTCFPFPSTFGIHRSCSDRQTQLAFSVGKMFFNHLVGNSRASIRSVGRLAKRQWRLDSLLYLFNFISKAPLPLPCRLRRCNRLDEYGGAYFIFQEHFCLVLAAPQVISTK